jgi:hypothetical protein
MCGPRAIGVGESSRVSPSAAALDTARASPAATIATGARNPHCFMEDPFLGRASASEAKARKSIAPCQLSEQAANSTFGQLNIASRREILRLACV